MLLRKLEERDAPLMLEWMHDDSVVHDLRTNFAEKTIADCKVFIEESQDDTENMHLAIVDDNDEYMGTVSLKHIKNKTAEFGIAVRKCAMGKGYSRYGMTSIIDMGFTTRDIQLVYWCVDPVNIRAIKFYDKQGYRRCGAPKQVESYSDEEKNKYIWYLVENKECYKKR